VKYWHVEAIAAKLAAVRDSKIRRLTINLPSRHLKSLLVTVAFPAWCLGRRPGTRVLCVSCLQNLADKRTSPAFAARAMSKPRIEFAVRARIGGSVRQLNRG
jgi:hypothetical protein